MNVGSWFAYWFFAVPLLGFCTAYMFTVDGHEEGFSKWWFRALCCLSIALVCFGVIGAVMGW